MQHAFSAWDGRRTGGGARKYTYTYIHTTRTRSTVAPPWIRCLRSAGMDSSPPPRVMSYRWCEGWSWVAQSIDAVDIVMGHR